MKSPKLYLALRNKEFALAIKTSLEKEGVEVIDVTVFGSAALRTIEREKPDFAFLDYSLKKVSAFNVISELKKKDVKTNFCVFYENPTNTDALVAKSLKIEHSILTTSSVRETIISIKKCIEGTIEDNAFDQLTSNDFRKEALYDLNIDHLEILTLLSVYGNIEEVATKRASLKQLFYDRIAELIGTLNFKTTEALIQWCKINRDLLLNVTLKVA